MLNETAMKIYQYIRNTVENDYPPTIREICTALEIKSTATVHKYINLLANEGYIEKLDNHNRAIRLKNISGTVNVPVIEKYTPGILLTAEENITGHILFAAENGSENHLFALKIKDGSMADSGILEGDIIIAEQTNHAEAGDIAAVPAGDNGLTVRALDDSSAEILGRVIALQRFF